MSKNFNGKLAAIIIAVAVIADQALKIWVKTHFYYGEELDITSWCLLKTPAWPSAWSWAASFCSHGSE